MNWKHALLLVGVMFLLGGSCDDDDDEAVFYAADINRDGYADIIIGAPLHDALGAAGSNRGAVFVHYGSNAGPSYSPDVVLYGAEDGAQFGFSVAVVGDANRDGLSDILVGAPYDDGDGNTTEDGTDRGRAFLFHGGPGMDSNADATMTGAEPGANFGWSVARAGDLNLDTFEDYIVGAPMDDGDGNGIDDGTDRGRAFVFLGRGAAASSPDYTFTGAELGSRFGWSVSSAGDINRGGAYDVAVGAPKAGAGGTERGAVYIYFGGDVLDEIADATFTVGEDYSDFGGAVGIGLDLNGDGIHDLIVGAPAHDVGGASGDDLGRAYVFYGGASVDATPDIIIDGTQIGGAFGSFVSRLGDVNRDNRDDFIVGAPLEDPGAITDAGSAYLFFGGPSVDAIADLTMSGAEAGGRFGSSLAGFGDINGWGRDIVIGAPKDDADNNATEDGLDRGRVFVFYGGVSLGNVANVTMSGTQDGAENGTSIGN